MKSLVTIFAFFSFNMAFCQQWQWGKRGGGTFTGKENLIDMGTDISGNVYILSSIGSDNTPTLTGFQGNVGSNGYSTDILLYTYNCEGIGRWKKTIGGWSGDEPISMGLDTLGHIFILGKCNQPSQYPFPLPQPAAVRFDSDSTIPFSNRKSLFLACYDTSGVLDWIRWIAPDSSTYTYQYKYIAYDMAVGKDGMVDILCSLPKSQIGNSLSGVTVSDTGGIYVLSYSQQGIITRIVKPAFSWSSVNNPSSTSNNTSLTNISLVKTNKSGKYILTGTQYFNPSSLNDSVRISSQTVGNSLFSAGFSNDLKTLNWLISNQSTDGAGFTSKPVLDNKDNIYLQGSGKVNEQIGTGFTITNDYGSYFSSPFILKIDSFGNIQKIKCASNQNYATEMGGGVAISGNYLVSSGAYVGNMSWDNKSVVGLPANSYYNTFLVKFDLQTLDVLAIDTLLSSYGFSEIPSSMCSDKYGNFYVGGSMEYDITIANNTLVSAGGQTDFYIAKYGLTQCGNNVIPLKLVSFDARFDNRGRDIICRWNTLSEINVESFAIEFSSDGLNYSPIILIKAKNSTNNYYEYIDKRLFPNNSNLYYRLKILDIDGSYYYSRIVKLSSAEHINFNIYPNPTKNIAYLRWNPNLIQPVDIRVSDSKGKLVYHYKNEYLSGSIKLDFSTLEVGTYFICVIDERHNATIKKIFVSH